MLERLKNGKLGDKTIKTKIVTIDRIIPTALAIPVGILYFTGQISETIPIVLGILAVIFLVTGFNGFCPLYASFWISSHRN